MTDPVSHADPATADYCRRLIAARNTHIDVDPELSVRWQHAQERVDDPNLAVSRAAIEEISAVLHEALTAVRPSVNNPPISWDDQREQQ
jgi:hypothetical protein